MHKAVLETLKEWLPNNWKTAYSEVEDKERIQQRLIGMMHRCMPTNDYALFCLSVRAVNGLIDEEIAEKKFKKYLDSHDADETLEDFDILMDGLPLSRFQINFQKFKSLVIDRYGWVFKNSLYDELPSFMPDDYRACDSYIFWIASKINWIWRGIKVDIIKQHNELIKNEALSILNRKWEDISVADYDRAVEMLRSIEAYPELINTLRNWIFIKGENGWKVKRSNKIEALRLEEEATCKEYNVTLQDWAELYGYDYNSGFKPENTQLGILNTLYDQGSGLAALILGDLYFEGALWPIVSDLLYDSVTKEILPKMLDIIAAGIKEALGYYEVAGMRGCAIGYRAQSLIYGIFGRKDVADELELKYSKAPYAKKRAAFNLLRDYRTIDEYERKVLIDNDYKDEDGTPCRDDLMPFPLSLLALVENRAERYIDRIFNEEIRMKLKEMYH